MSLAPELKPGEPTTAAAAPPEVLRVEQLSRHYAVRSNWFKPTRVRHQAL